MHLDDLTKQVWDKAQDCECQLADCETNHKLCGICGKTIVYTAHESNQPNSAYAWNRDHITPLSKGGKTELNNLQATHVQCNHKKGNKEESIQVIDTIEDE